MTPRLVPAILLAALAVALVRPAAADCRRHARGRPIFRETVGGLGGAGAHTAPQQRFAIYADGTWVRHGDPAFGDAEPLDTIGCVAAPALREVTAAVARARFRYIQAPTCDALSDRHVILEAPRRGKRIATERPCGRPIDPGTAALAACAELIMVRGDVPIDVLQPICHPPR